jgi:hypothetical protein
MDLTGCMLRLAGEMDGRFIEYTSAISIITVPVEGCSCQNVIGQLINKNGEQVLVLTSKVCELCAEEENHKVILRLNQELFYCKIIIQDWQLQVTAETLFINCTEQLLKEMILEVAQVAFFLDHKIISTDMVEA